MSRSKPFSFEQLARSEEIAFNDFSSLGGKRLTAVGSDVKDTY